MGVYSGLGIFGYVGGNVIFRRLRMLFGNMGCFLFFLFVMCFFDYERGVGVEIWRAILELEEGDLGFSVKRVCLEGYY